MENSLTDRKIPPLNPETYSERSVMYSPQRQQQCSEIIYRYLFEGKSYRVLEREVLNKKSERGFLVMEILHHYGMRDKEDDSFLKFKGIFKDHSPGEAISILRDSSGDYSEIIAAIKEFTEYSILPEPMLPEELKVEDDFTYFEGSKTKITVNAYERNKIGRIKCIEHYKEKRGGRIMCEICDFEFKSVYGNEFEGIIHIHHIVEISSVGEEYILDPINDLAPLCPNCHAAVHRKTPPYTIDELKMKIYKN